MRLSSPIYALKRDAKRLARDEGIRLYEALNQIAVKEGFSDWSHLASRYAKTSPAMKIIHQLDPGDMVLVGARPGHGKTLLGLELALLAETVDRAGHVFSLDYTDADVWGQFKRLGFDPKGHDRPIRVDTSDDICAGHILDCLGHAGESALIVVDYLQLLDQKRSHPTLHEQVRTLKEFAVESGAIVVLISQIDRAFELSPRTMPSMADVRLPNPVDLTLFDKLCFLHDGQIQMDRAA